MSALVCRTIPFAGLIALLLLAISPALGVKDREKPLINKIFDPARYDPSTFPSGNLTDGGVQISVNFYIRGIEAMECEKNQFKTQLTFRTEWHDERVRSPTSLSDPLIFSNASRIWKPDLFFQNERAGYLHEVLMPNILVRISPQGDVFYSTRVSLTLGCEMDLKRYPFDEHICPIRIASYAFSIEDIVLFWRHYDPVQISRTAHPPGFRVVKVLTRTCTARTNTRDGGMQEYHPSRYHHMPMEYTFNDEGTYSCLEAQVFLRRSRGGPFLKLILPLGVLALLSHVPLWYFKKSPNTRLIIGTTVVLLMGIVWSNTEKLTVDYPTAADVWAAGCLFTALAALLLSALAINKDNDKGQNQGDQAASLENPKSDTRAEGSSFISRIRAKSSQPETLSRLGLPLIFALFNLIFWTAYLPSYEEYY